MAEAGNVNHPPREIPKRQAIPKSEVVNRRNFLRRAGAAALGAVAGAVSGAEAIGMLKAIGKVPQSASGSADRINKPPQTESIEADNGNEDLNKINQILALKLGSGERLKAEKAYVNSAHIKEQIDFGLRAVADKNLRKILINKRWELRQNGKDGLKMINPDQINWAKNNGIHPEVLAICEESYRVALELMESLQTKGIYNRTVPARDMLISPGGMTMVLQTESSGLINIGHLPAIEQINSQEFPEEKEALYALLRELSDKTGIGYIAENVPGSEKPDNQGATGGALGPAQIMPASALGVAKEITLTSDSPPILDIFDPSLASVAAWILLAEKGYYVFKTDPVLNDNLKQWNNDPVQIKRIIDADKSYRELIGKGSSLF